jgi:hypothetical protein
MVRTSAQTYLNNSYLADLIFKKNAIPTEFKIYTKAKNAV